MQLILRTMEEEEFESGSLIEDGGETEAEVGGSRRSTDDEEEEDSSDDEEPKLKFERLGNDFSKILDKDAVSCVAVHPKVRSMGKEAFGLKKSLIQIHHLPVSLVYITLAS